MMGGPSAGGGFAAGLGQVGKQGGSLFGAPQATKPGSGGIAYGAASSAGGLFGAASAAGPSTFASGLSGVGKMGSMGGAASGFGGTQFGAPKPASAGGFALGGASKFQGAGGLTFGGAAAFGGAPGQSDDPYDIPLDLTKIKAKKQPEKLFEEKSSQEKLMTMKQVESQNRATGAKSIIKKPGEKKKYGSVTFGKCQIFEYEKHGDEIAEKVDIKDISDMRDEKTKLKDNIQEQENA